jgi:peptidoglycan/xylan/chitin deacetylase (PgdA/CDA1 family)
MIDVIQQFVRSTDAAVARVYLSLFQERNALINFLFHSLFRDERDIAKNLVDPLERTTVAKFRQLIEYYVAHGYRFVSPDDLLNGLGSDGKYAMLTFDDGYFNNSLALPILEEFKVPALFFISTNHVRRQKSFWWDALYRERAAQGASQRELHHNAMAMKDRRTDQIEAELIERFGSDVLRPRGDLDRPFTESELRDFVRHPLVHIGNHTADHAILTNYTSQEARQQVMGAQEALREMTGVEPISIAYPNGAHNESIVQICREVGLKLGFTIRPEKISLPLGADLMQLGRFVPDGHGRIDSQCRTYRSDLLLYGKFRGGFLKLVGAER